jgi:Domain of unknown function (DUF4397)
MRSGSRLARIASLLTPVVAGFWLLAGASAGPATAALATSAAGGSGWLRLAHLSPNTPAVDVYLYSFGDARAVLVVHHVAYGTVSAYQRVPSGEYTVAMRGAGAPASTAPVISATVDVHPGAAYTVAGMGPAKGLRLEVLADRLRTPRGKALVRIIQASLAQHRITIKTGGHVLVHGLPFAAVSAYRAVSPSTWSVSAIGSAERTHSTITLSAGTIHTIVVLDDPGHLSLDDIVDAAGSRIVPIGAPATGLGGTAPRPGPSDLRWLALIGSGLLLGLYGARWATRPAGPRVPRRHRPPSVT